MRPSNALSLALASISVLVPLTASAQGEQPPVAPEPAAEKPAKAEKVELDDPDLKPTARAKRELGSWREILDLIASRSTDRTIATQEIERARGLRRQALGAALPLITATGSLTHHFIRTEASTIDVDTGAIVREEFPRSPTALASLTVTQPILAPRAWYAVGTEGTRVEAAELAVGNGDRAIVIAVADAVVGVVTAERLAEVNRVSLRGALERLELTRRSRALGSATQLDVVRVEQDVSVARANVVAGDEGLQKAREGLGLSLGLSEGVGVSPNISLDTLERDTRATCDDTSPNERPDVVLAKKQLEIAEREVTDADLRYLPTADVSSTLSYGSEVFANGLNYSWSIQGVLTVPIWDGGVRYGARQAAEAGVLQEQARVEAAERGATLEHGQTTRGVQVALRARQIAKDARDLAAETERLSKVAFEGGVGTSFDLVDSGRRLREAELDLAVKEFQVVDARIAALLSASRCSL